MSSGAIGTRQLRAEDPRLLTGRGRYLADIELPGMLEVAFLRSNVAHARIDDISYDFALGLDGIDTVLVAEDLPDIQLVSTRHPDLLRTPQRPLAKDKVRFVGEALAMAVAENRYVAEDALDLIEVRLTELPVAGSNNVDYESLFDHIPDDIVFRERQDYGDSAAAFDGAALIVTKTLDFSRQSASPIETRGCIADFDPATRRLTMYASTQAPHRLRRDLASALGLPEHNVRVVMHDVGGAFGQKIPTHVEDVAVAAAAMLLGRPIRWVEDRRENLIAGPHARGTKVTAQLALDDAHRFVGLRASLLGDSGAYSANSTSCLTESYRTARALPGPYRIANYSYDLEIRLTNRSPISAYRGVGFVTAQVIRELLVDEAARQLACDRFELRRQNLIPNDRFPYTTCTGWVLNEASLVESLDRAERLLDEVDDEQTSPAGGVDGQVLRGVGICPFIEPSGTGSQGGQQVHGFPASSHDAARVVVDTDGKATVIFGTPSMGQGLETTMAQVAAEALGLPIADVSVAWTDTSQAPISLTGARASRSATVTGGAVARAAHDVRAQILEVAAGKLEADANDLRISDGSIYVAGEGEPRLSVANVVHAGFFDVTLRDPDRERTFESTRLYDPPATYSNACVVAVVDVDSATGGVRVKRVIGVEDCGTVINPMIVDGQFVGGAAQGIGSALFERFQYDSAGQPTTSTLMDYLLPTAQETVHVTTEHIETRAEHNEYGIKGMGESGVIGTTAAIACAVTDALGSSAGTQCRLPLLPADVWSLLHPDDRA